MVKPIFKEELKEPELSSDNVVAPPEETPEEATEIKAAKPKPEIKNKKNTDSNTKNEPEKNEPDDPENKWIKAFKDFITALRDALLGVSSLEGMKNVENKPQESESLAIQPDKSIMASDGSTVPLKPPSSTNSPVIVTMQQISDFQPPTAAPKPEIRPEDLDDRKKLTT